MKRDHEKPVSVPPIHQIMNGIGSDKGIVDSATGKPNVGKEVFETKCRQQASSRESHATTNFRAYHSAAIQTYPATTNVINQWTASISVFALVNTVK